MKVLFPYEVVYEMIRINSMYSVGLGSVPSLLTDHLELQHNANFEQQIVQNKWLFLALIFRIPLFKATKPKVSCLITCEKSYKSLIFFKNG